MISAVSRGRSNPLVAVVHPGAEVLYRWAKWQKQHAYPQTIQSVVLCKEGRQLVVYEYANAPCVVITRCANGPRMRNFREWRQPFSVVQAKLKVRGWEPVQRPEEVRYAH